MYRVDCGREHCEFCPDTWEDRDIAVMGKHFHAEFTGVEPEIEEIL